MVTVNELLQQQDGKRNSIILFIENNNILLESAQGFLIEAKYEKVPGSQISSRYDSANTTTKTDGHHHFFLKGNELYAVNDGGGAHHRSNRGVTIDRKVADFLISKGVHVPNNRVLETIDLAPKTMYRQYLFEINA